MRRGYYRSCTKFLLHSYFLGITGKWFGSVRAVVQQPFHSKWKQKFWSYFNNRGFFSACSKLCFKKLSNFSSLWLVHIIPTSISVLKYIKRKSLRRILERFLLQNFVLISGRALLKLCLFACLIFFPPNFLRTYTLSLILSLLDFWKIMLPAF